MIQHRVHIFIFSLVLLFCCSCGREAVEGGQLYTAEEFLSPEMKWRPIPLWFWNDVQVTEDGLEYQLRSMIEKDLYGGCAILPFGAGFKPEYLGEEYFRLYGKAIEIARSYGARMSLYDEYGFPSGSMGAKHGDGRPRLMEKHPGMTLKRLDKDEYACVAGVPMNVSLAGAEGRIMAVTAFDRRTGKVLDLSDNVSDGVLSWTPDDGAWTVMVFRCMVDGDPNVDYLSSEAVAHFVQDTHGAYYERFPDAFGSTICSTFFDEPTMYRSSGRVWTDGFNEKFFEKYGFKPDCLYPALWYNIGPGTALARCQMYGLRSELYAEGFMKTIGDWSRAHGIESTGHQDQEEILNTTSLSGDLMLCGKYMTMPGIDKIGGDRPAERFYKVVSSSAQNWDHQNVMSETFGAMGDIPVDSLYKTGIEQFSKGITDLISHAVWYDDAHVTFKPELSWRNPLYRDELPAFNTFLARLRYILARPGRHVADVAVLYPVQTQYAGHYMDGPLGRFDGGVAIEGTNYDRLSTTLTDSLGVDFTYLHPEVLAERCEVEKGRLTMHNEINEESFRVVMLPSVRVVDIDDLRKVEQAARKGVKVIFAGLLPEQSATVEASDEEVGAIVESMLEKGLASFIPDVDPATVASALAGIRLDVESDGTPAFNYLHKVVDGHDVYLMGNIGNETITRTVSLRGTFRHLCALDPRTGAISHLDSRCRGGRTNFQLTLSPAQSRIMMSEASVSLL